VIRTFQYALLPTRRQQRRLDDLLRLSSELYNAALEERTSAWRTHRKRIGYFEQSKELTELRREDQAIRALPVELAREPLRRVHRAFQAFFRRVRAGQKAGYPRFRSGDRYNSFSLSAPAFRMEGPNVLIAKLGGFRLRLHRPLRGTPIHLMVVRSGRRWRASIASDIGPAPEKRPVIRVMGVDLGVQSFATLSDGQVVENPRWTKQSEEQIGRWQRLLARKQRRSGNRKRARLALARAYERLGNRRRNFCHQVSKWLIEKYDLIALEKLNIAGMVRGHFSKSVLDAAWGELLGQLAYKAEEAGKFVVAVAPHGTSQICSNCGAVVPKGVEERRHECNQCGLSLSRDHNAALNILALGRSAVGLAPPEVQI
jgi:putative transposase